MLIIPWLIWPYLSKIIIMSIITLLGFGWSLSHFFFYFDGFPKSKDKVEMCCSVITFAPPCWDSTGRTSLTTSPGRGSSWQVWIQCLPSHHTPLTGVIPFAILLFLNFKILTNIRRLKARMANKKLSSALSGWKCRSILWSGISISNSR